MGTATPQQITEQRNHLAQVAAAYANLVSGAIRWEQFAATPELAEALAWKKLTEAREILAAWTSAATRMSDIGTEAKQLADGRTVVVRAGIVGGVKIGNQLVMDGKIRTVNGRHTGPPLEGEWEKQITLYFTDSHIGVRGDEAETVYHLEEREHEQ